MASLTKTEIAVSRGFLALGHRVSLSPLLSELCFQRISQVCLSSFNTPCVSSGSSFRYRTLSSIPYLLVTSTSSYANVTSQFKGQCLREAMPVSTEPSRALPVLSPMETRCFFFTALTRVSMRYLYTSLMSGHLPILTENDIGTGTGSVSVPT